MSSSRTRPLHAGLILLLLMCASCTKGFEDPVQLEDGLVSGVQLVDSPVRAYKGIPFAAPPVGELRWQPPQPVVPWDGVKMADTFSDACVQVLGRSRPPWTEEFMHQGDASEDCLYLNVWTAAQTKDEKRPVMVYIYGGGFNEGSSAIETYDGEELAKKGVVLVSINYRVGPIGFLAHPELTAESEHGASGNYGLLDPVAALRWVKNNISAFGGDPDQVTIFGQSAGAMAVAYLMASPLSRDLIDGAIIMSGPGLFSMASRGAPLASGEEAGLAMQEALGAGSLAELRALPAERFFEQGIGRSGPITDGWFLPEDNPHDIEAVVMNGLTSGEVNMGFAFGPPPEATVAAYEAEAAERFGEDAATFLALYPASSDEEVPALRMASATDRARTSLYLWADAQKEKSPEVFTYFFDRAMPWAEHPEFGAHHTQEVPYAFNTVDRVNRQSEPVDLAVADHMSSYWSNFAKTGNPNGEGLPEWPAFSGSADVTMRIAAESGAIPIADPEKAAFWKKVLAGQ